MDKNPGCCSTDGHPHPFSYSSTIPSSTVYYQVVSSSTPSANGKQLRIVTVPPGNDGRHGGRNDQHAKCFSLSSNEAVFWRPPRPRHRCRQLLSHWRGILNLHESVLTNFIAIAMDDCDDDPKGRDRRAEAPSRAAAARHEKRGEPSTTC